MIQSHISYDANLIECFFKLWFEIQPHIFNDGWLLFRNNLNFLRTIFSKKNYIFFILFSVHGVYHKFKTIHFLDFHLSVVCIFLQKIYECKM